MTWTCDRTRHSLRRQAELPVEAIEHLARCALCQELTDLAPEARGSLTHAEPSVLDMAQLLAATQQRLASERGAWAWLRSRSTSERWALGMVFALLPVMLQWFVARRADFGEYPLPRLSMLVAAYVVVIACAARSLLAPLHQPKAGWQNAVMAGLAFALPLLVAATAPAYALEPASSAVSNGLFLKQAGACLRYGALLAIPSVALLFVMDRQMASGRQFSTTAAAIGGAVGNFVLLLHCANEDPAHQLLGHASVGVLLLAFLDGRRALFPCREL